MSEAIILSGVSKSFGDKQAVNALDLEIPSGTVYGLLGPNGSGKSTTMKMIMGLIKPTSGKVSVYGVDPQTDPLAVKKMIGYVPETPRLYEFLTAYEYIDFICTIHGFDTKQQEPRIREFLEAFELAGHENEMIGGYSHGMKQKVAIIAALLGKPRLLILDEPLGGLDPKSARIMKDLIHKLAHEGVTTIFSTHVMEIADAVCDRIGILYNGKKLAEGTASELRSMSGLQGSSLEEVFLKLTGSSDVKPIVDALAS
ncbi:MAG: ABC transporter ATP-binding protein [Candidatus Bathyarchaeota archaeon]|nr:ABC transporter ATP-binding protein [Candidatus Bathyarchaeota archaeon]